MENHNKKNVYHSLNIKADTSFIRSVLNECQVDAESAVFWALLEMLYDLTKQTLIEAKNFAALLNKQSLDVADFRIAKIEKIDDYRAGPLQLSSMGADVIPVPLAKTNLLLPPWRNCQLAANIELKEREQPQPPADNNVRPPPTKRPHTRKLGNSTKPI